MGVLCREKKLFPLCEIGITYRLKKLRFEWEKNDELDVDTDIEINKDLRQNIYYRLELIDTLTNVVSFLEDSLLHNNFVGFENTYEV